MTTITLILCGLILLLSWRKFCLGIAYGIRDERLHSRRRFINFVAHVFLPMVSDRETIRYPPIGNDPLLRAALLGYVVLG